MDTAKIDRSVKLIREMADIIEKIVAAEAMLTLAENKTPADEEVFNNVEKWANLMSGNASGYEQEIKNYYKFRIRKGQDVQRGKNADVSITNPVTGISKAIQLKSTNQDGAGAVTNMIAEAANQLAGERGETPLSHQRRVIDIAIRSPSNPWPFGALKGRGTQSEMLLRQEAENVIHRALNDYLKHGTVKVNPSTGQPNKNPSEGKGLSPGAMAAMTDVSALRPGYNVTEAKRLVDRFNNPVAPRTTARVITDPLNTVVAVVIDITIKVRYDFPYSAVNPGHNPLDPNSKRFRWIEELKFQAELQGPNLVVRHVQTYYVD